MQSRLASYSARRLVFRPFRFSHHDRRTSCSHAQVTFAEVHRRLAKEAVLDVVQHYHSDLAQRLSDEAALIARRTAIVERLHEREQQIKDDSA